MNRGYLWILYLLGFLASIVLDVVFNYLVLYFLLILSSLLSIINFKFYFRKLTIVLFDYFEKSVKLLKFYFNNILNILHLKLICGFSCETLFLTNVMSILLLIFFSFKIYKISKLNNYLLKIIKLRFKTSYFFIKIRLI